MAEGLPEEFHPPVNEADLEFEKFEVETGTAVPDSDPVAPVKKPTGWKWAIGCVAAGLVVCCCLTVAAVVLSNYGSDYSPSPYSSSSSTTSDPGDAGIPLYGDPSQPLEITKTTALETDADIQAAFETMQSVDYELDELLDYAVDLGDIPSSYQVVAGDQSWLSNGTMYVGLVVGDGSPENSVIVIQAYMEEGQQYDSEGTILARVSGTDENPTLTLYDQDGSVEIGEGGAVYEGRSPTVSPLVVDPAGSRPSGLSAPCPGGNCTTSTWDDYMGCIKDVGGTPTLVGMSCAASLVALKAAWTSGPWGVGAAAIAVAASCGAPWMYCVPYAGDDAPEYEVLSMETDPTGRFSICVFQGDQEVLQVYRPYEVKISWDDDRRPFADYGVRTVNTLQYGGILQESATDCGGNTTFAEINVLPSELIEEQPCPGMCIDPLDGTAHCEEAVETDEVEPTAAVPTAAPLPTRSEPSGSETESGTVVYEGVSSMVSACAASPGCTLLENSIYISFQLEGGPVDGTSVFSERGMLSPGCGETMYISAATLSGTYDPVSGSMQGTVTVIWEGDVFSMTGGVCTLKHVFEQRSGTFEAVYNSDAGIHGNFFKDGANVGDFVLRTIVTGP